MLECLSGNQAKIKEVSLADSATEHLWSPSLWHKRNYKRHPRWTLPLCHLSLVGHNPWHCSRYFLVVQLTWVISVPWNTWVYSTRFPHRVALPRMWGAGHRRSFRLIIPRAISYRYRRKKRTVSPYGRRHIKNQYFGNVLSKIIDESAQIHREVPADALLQSKNTCRSIWLFGNGSKYQSKASEVSWMSEKRDTVSAISSDRNALWTVHTGGFDVSCCTKRADTLMVSAIPCKQMIILCTDTNSLHIIWSTSTLWLVD